MTALKSARALGVVCHFVNTKSAWENALPEANWAQQYHTARFAKLKARGVALQNIVYYRSTGAFAAHLAKCTMRDAVMTCEKQSVADALLTEVELSTGAPRPTRASPPPLARPTRAALLWPQCSRR